MNCYEKKRELHSKIVSSIKPLITGNYWLVNVPYYANVGDMLIWQGEMDFLSTLPYKCKGMCSIETFAWPKISSEDLILLQGGGDIGDTWTRMHEFVMSVAKHYKNNRVLMLPQSVFFSDNAKMQDCADSIAECDNFIICARDKMSYECLKENFKNRSLLVPDMAFAIDMRRWDKSQIGDGPLFIKRTDKELLENNACREFELLSGITVEDWMTISKPNKMMERIMMSLKRRPRCHALLDAFGRWFYRPYVLRTGVRQIASHSEIYTTRLHAMILSVLLQKDRVVATNNSYGKNKNFYETWLRDCDAVSFVE